MKRNVRFGIGLLSTAAMLVAFAAAAGTPVDGHDHHGSSMESDKDALHAQEVCPVLGNPINQDVFVIHQGQKVYFCCPGCEDKFLKDPESHFTGMAERGVTAESVQTVCPVSGEELPDKDTYVDYIGRRIYFCCPGCDKDFEMAPAKYLKLVK